jgi:hypothetical protein
MKRSRQRSHFSYNAFLGGHQERIVRNLFLHAQSDTLSFQKVEILKEAITSTEGARKLLRIARKESPEEKGRELEERPVPELLLAGRPLQRRRICRTFGNCAAAPRKGLVSGRYPLHDFYKKLPEGTALVEVECRSKE